ncbi:MAG: tyrosine-type recombinase/integrase [Betaproteobacteria bacterium]|nr:tyrosine-type recombinase/integrase [Betaproteobacteria bacterium]
MDHVQRKTGVRLVIQWTDELRSIVERALNSRGTKRAERSAFLFARRRGGRYTQSGFQTLWQRVQQAWGKANNERFTWHDLRAKALTDADAQGGNAQALAGHASAQMTQRYIKQKRVKVVDPLRRSSQGQPATRPDRD